MARSPFQGTYVSGVRPTIVTAPDALVYINGNAEALTCAQCQRRFPFNKYITSIQVDLSIDSVPGSATINLSIPRHSVDDFFFDGDPIVAEMMEIEIFAKGHFLVEGLPQYYPIFWGLVTEVTDDYSGGETTVTIHCADILKWWELCKMATNSALTSPQPGARGMSLLGNVFYGSNPYDMIWTLAQQSFGDVVVGTGSLVNFIPEKGSQKAAFQAAMQDIMLYWNERFTRMRSNLLLYGTQGVAVRGDTLYATYHSGKDNQARLKNLASRAVAQANGGPDAGQMIFDPTDPNVVAFKTIFQVNVPFWQSEYQTKLELATATKEAIGFEFYMDVDGSLVFKPPFFNLDTLGNKPVSWIQDIDIIDWSGSKSEAEVITQIQMQGSMHGSVDYGLGEETTPITTVTDYHLLRQFGWRTKTYNSEFLGDPLQMFYHGMDMLDRENSRRHRASVTIPLRPELRLGFPVYVAFKDQMWYVNGISHNIQFGGRAQTSLTLTARRKKWIAPRGIGTISLSGFAGKASPTDAARPTVRYSSRQLQKAGQFEVVLPDPAVLPPTEDIDTSTSNPYEPMVLRHPKTGRIVGFPNAVMVYTRPMQAPDNVVKQNAGRGTPKVISKENQSKVLERGEKELSALKKAVNFDTDVHLRERYITNRYSYGVNSAGAYVYARDKGQLLQELLLLPSKNIDVKALSGTVEGPKHSSAMIRPVSDERGFEVVGHFRYGRGVSLRDGRLVVRDGKDSGTATVSTQVALVGDLQAMLTAQSQGITTITTDYANPADTLASMTPEDTQVAGALNPNTKEIEWSEDTFVKTATKGSPEQEGVEAAVDATLLSRALTLAEMSVAIDSVLKDPDCPCLLGRGELAFMNVGYNVKTVNAAVPDTSDLGPPRSFTVGEMDLDPGNPTGSLSKIDSFLFDLYHAIDKDHHAYEKTIRGETLPSDQNSVTDIRFGTVTPQTGDLSPPFSAPGRFGVGDPRALATQANSATRDLAQKWDSFGSSLKTAAESAALNTQISQDRTDLTRVQSQLEQLQRAMNTPQEDAVARALGNKTSAELLAEYQARIAQLQNNIHMNETRLSNLR